MELPEKLPLADSRKLCSEPVFMWEGRVDAYREQQKLDQAILDKWVKAHKRLVFMWEGRVDAYREQQKLDQIKDIPEGKLCCNEGYVSCEYAKYRCCQVTDKELVWEDKSPYFTKDPSCPKYKEAK